MNSYIKALLTCLTAVILAACGDGGSSGNPVASAVSKQAASEAPAVLKASTPGLQGYALSTVIWQQMPLGVCWDMNSSEFVQTAVQRGWTRSAVEETWAANSGLEFKGWEQCTNDPNFYGLRVSQEDNAARAPHTTQLGKLLNNLSGGVVLNFSFKNWSPSCQNRLEYCIRATGVHEFGHALGFSHEQNRPDTPATCDQPPQGRDGDTLIGAWDLASVMNYCNPQWNGDGKLSATDIEMVQKFYGMPTAKGTLYVLESGAGPAVYGRPATIRAYDAATHASKALIELLPDWQYRYVSQMATSPNGKRLYAVLTKENAPYVYEAKLVIIDTVSNKVINSVAIEEVNAWLNLTISPDSKRIYIPRVIKRYVEVLDAESGAQIKQIPIPTGYPRVVSAPIGDADTIFVLADTYSAMDVHQISVSKGSVQRTFSNVSFVGPGANQFGLAVTPDAKFAYFPHYATYQDPKPDAAELNLTTGAVTVLKSLGTIRPDFWQLTGDQQILFDDFTFPNAPYPIMLLDPKTKTQTTIGGAGYYGNVLYEPGSRTIFFVDKDRRVQQQVRQADGSYQTVALDFPVSTWVSPMQSMFVFAPN